MFMDQQKELIAPEILEALLSQATASGLTVNDYLARLLDLAHERNGELALSEVNGDAGAQTLTPFEQIENLLGVFDSTEPFERTKRERDAFGRGVIAKLEKQGLKLP